MDKFTADTKDGGLVQKSSLQNYQDLAHNTCCGLVCPSWTSPNCWANVRLSNMLMWPCIYDIVEMPSSQAIGYGIGGHKEWLD